MAKSNYGYVQINSISNSPTSEFNIMNSSQYSSFSYISPASASTNAVNFEQSPFPALYFTEQGDYQIVVSLYTSASANTTAQVKIEHVSFSSPQGVLNTFSFDINSAAGVTQNERTIQAMIKNTPDALNGIQVKMTDTSGNTSVYPGTSIFITKMNSGFASIELTGDTAEQAAEYNPFDTTQAPGSSATTSVLADDSGIVSETSAGTGSLETTTAGLGVFLYTGVQYRASAGSANVNAKFYENDTDVDGLTFTNYRASSEDPIEASFFVVKEFSANDVLRIGNQSTQAFSNNTGSAISFYQPNSNSHFRFVSTKNSSNAISSGSTFTLFDEDFYSTYAPVNYGSGITYTSTNGRFTVSRDGDYLILLSTRPDPGGVDTPGYLALTSLKNSNPIQSVDNYFSLAIDPVERTSMFLMQTASAGDFFSIKAVANGALTNGIDDATAILVLELFEADPAPPGPPVFNQGTPGNLISDDFTINTYAQDVLSVQYDRQGSAQVPFVLGNRGPLTIRGRTLAQVIKKGDKKN